ncbi:MAG: hypothetical protein GC203_02715 [Phenylobacterium sp.]|uniref:hypothetical protein n=1 Tax=Phenylobacterium sp. TaxID=1871053 RepID=UPI0025EF7421|nr:hypothetical protein [Phenylobacterium sp.]MBI1196753.1 hypothetical protein [Phenylobacterium sp.]
MSPPASARTHHRPSEPASEHAQATRELEAEVQALRQFAEKAWEESLPALMAAKSLSDMVAQVNPKEFAQAVKTFGSAGPRLDGLCKWWRGARPWLLIAGFVIVQRVSNLSFGDLSDLLKHLGGVL